MPPLFFYHLTDFYFSKKCLLRTRGRVVATWAEASEGEAQGECGLINQYKVRLCNRPQYVRGQRAASYAVDGESHWRSSLCLCCDCGWPPRPLCCGRGRTAAAPRLRSDQPGKHKTCCGVLHYEGCYTNAHSPKSLSVATAIPYFSKKELQAHLKCYKDKNRQESARIQPR